ncbi:aldo/keto reductase [Hymenobacter sp. BT559]|uniref:aldo/keto reductase n=1 Tax=Hymenobacter sp. BT559 TaxID=2795729 RepID=UPI0018EC82B0|nr:aldo/keto reductase [Hymenobacter sp. BT559]MBJ6145390.1 aldo/keto reductase [Hymenobacter sp. BT559]
MHYRQLGRTDMHVSLLSLGASALGGVFADIDPAQGIRTVHEAVDQGVNFIDVAPYYGFTKAETVLGQALRTLPRPQYMLSTKVGRYGHDGVKTWDYSAARVTQSVEESLARLHTDYLDLLSVHDVEFADLEQVVHETIPALQGLKAAGKVRYIGITGLPLAKLRYILNRVPAGTLDTVLSFCHHCLNDDTLGKHVAYFREREVGVINAAPLAMGLLSTQGPPAWHPASATLKDHAQRAAALCADRGYPIEQLAIQFAVSHPGVSTTLVSAACPRLMRQNIEWASTPPDPDLLREVRALLHPVLGETWDNS